jgi:hypothetical protein
MGTSDCTGYVAIVRVLCPLNGDLITNKII